MPLLMLQGTLVLSISMSNCDCQTSDNVVLKNPAWHNETGSPDIQTLHVSEALDLAEQTRINGHYVEAEALYGLILQAAPENADYWNVFGEVKQKQNRYQEAVAAFQKALELQPNHVAALENVGNVLAYLGDAHNSAKSYCRAIIAKRANIKSSMLLGMSYSSLGKIEEATEVYRQWLQNEPENPIAAHFYAACSGNNTPELASNSYIENTFDGFSSDFDEHLTLNLSYRVPQLIGEVLARHFLPEGNLKTLDAGCGTGLCGAVMAPYAKYLTGEDLSSVMLSVARKLGLYDALIKKEITEFLSEKREEYDMIVMADTLIYFGSLKTIFSAIFQALTTRGLFVFSVENSRECAEKNGSTLNHNGRYSHTQRYIEDSLKRNGLTPLSIEPHILRMELGCPVDGMLVTAIKGSGQ